MYFSAPREEPKALTTRYAFMQEMSNQILENYALIRVLHQLNQIFAKIFKTSLTLIA